MSGKKGTTRTATMKDSKALRKNIARMAHKWGWSVKEFEEYLLRMGVNRVMALERYTPGGKKRAKKAPKRKAARKASPRRAKVAKTTNHAAAPATPAATANATG